MTPKQHALWARAEAVAARAGIGGDVERAGRELDAELGPAWPPSTISRVRLPIDDVIDQVWDGIFSGTAPEAHGVLHRALGILAEQTPFVLRGVLARARDIP